VADRRDKDRRYCTLAHLVSGEPVSDGLHETEEPISPHRKRHEIVMQIESTRSFAGKLWSEARAIIRLDSLNGEGEIELF
jgi:hypothetical protein